MGFSVETGNVTVDLENKSKPKAAVSYRKFSVEADTLLVDLIETLGKEGVSEDLTVETGDDGEKSVKSGTTSMTQLLADGFNRYSYTQAVAKAKEAFNNSPEKQDSWFTGKLREIIDNPDTTPTRRERARKQLDLM